MRPPVCTEAPRCISFSSRPLPSTVGLGVSFASLQSLVRYSYLNGVGYLGCSPAGDWPMDILPIFKYPLIEANDLIKVFI